MTSTQSILDHHLQCFGAANLEGVLADYRADSIILTPDGAINGLNGIRGFFTQAFAEFARPGTRFSMKTALVAGDCAFIAWEAETVDKQFEAATDTFVGPVPLQP